ncbi:hypothetical protein CDCA_CDCA05G1587 [Cyanidium caldarium]|uniref:ETFB lysine methyltransferase n=1 Tax=Cyanidium caldarium TaxID=2771 RepID=A0AAV9ITA9_CYACA|nr:hypothetical protein CDCA_CDCA05G1587 [Cyanidium caldarium]
MADGAPSAPQTGFRWVTFVSEDVPDADAELASEWLLELGAVAVEWTGVDGQQPRHLRAMLPVQLSVDGVRMQLATAFEWPRWPRVQAMATVDEHVDWVRQVQDAFQPVRVGRRLLVRYPWNVLSGAGGDAADASRIALTINPSCAFGTGEHATTQMAAEWLERHVFPGARVLDCGSGSGILVLFACLLGASTADSLGVDTDVGANVEARANAARNGVTGALQFLTPDEAAPRLRQAAFDLVVSNISAEALRELAPLLSRCLRPGGRIALTGLTAGQAPDVTAAYAACGVAVEEATARPSRVFVGSTESRVEGARAVAAVANDQHAWVCLSGKRVQP